MNKTSQNITKITKENPEINKNARKIEQNAQKMTKILQEWQKLQKTKMMHNKLYKNSQNMTTNAKQY